MRMLEVGETSHAGCLEVKDIRIFRDLCQLRLKATNLFDWHSGSEKFEGERKIRGRNPFDAVIVRAQLRNESLDRAFHLEVDANRDECANLFGNHPEAELPQRHGDTENRSKRKAATFSILPLCLRASVVISAPTCPAPTPPMVADRCRRTSSPRRRWSANRSRHAGSNPRRWFAACLCKAAN